MKKKIVFFDFDGTLFDHEQKEIPRSAMEVLRVLSQDPNTYTVLATGRTHYNLTPFAKRHDFFDGFILLNGLHTSFQGTLLDEQLVPSSMATPVIDTLDELGLVYGAFAASGQYISQRTPEIVAEFASVSFDLPDVGEIRNVPDIQQLFCFTPKRNYEVIAQRHPAFRVIPWDIDGCDIIPRHASKAEGIRAILSTLKDEVTSYAFGDAMNDLEMFRVVDTSIALGNAIDELKAIATFVTDDVAHDGIYKAAKQLGWIK